MATQVTSTEYDEHAGAGSAYGQARVRLGSRLTVTPGARVDHWSLTDSTTASPWVNAALRLSDRTRLLGGTGVYRQFASLDDVFGPNGGGRDLRPERALHIDAGIEQSLAHETRLLINVYARHEEDVLRAYGSETRQSNGIIVPPAENPMFANGLSGTARGVEVVLRRDTASGFSGWAGYAYGELKYTDSITGERFWADFDQRHTLSLYANYRLSSKASVSARYRYGANYPITGYLTHAVPPLGPAPINEGVPQFYALAEQRNELRLPGYSRLDVRADRAFKWSSRRIVLFVDVANILNQTNRRNTPYFVDRLGRVFGVTETLMPIVPAGGLVIEF
jgi:outer membrane cobalamin receptor